MSAFITCCLKNPLQLLAKTFFALEITVPDSKSRNIPEVVIVRRRAVGVLGIWEGWGSWVKGGAKAT